MVVARTSDERLPLALQKPDACHRCHEWRNDPSACTCVRFEIALQDRPPSDDADWTYVWAYDAQDAVEAYARRYDSESAEYTIVRGNRKEFTAWVRFSDRRLTKWAVSGESEPTYSAHGVHI